MKKLLPIFVFAFSSFALAAELRRDLPDIFRKHYVLRSNGVDFNLDYRLGSASYRLNDVFGKNHVLEMVEELTVYDTERNDDIEMCNGTVTELERDLKGVTYGTIDKKTQMFEGQFVIKAHTYYVESADKFYEKSELENTDIVSIAYADFDVIGKDNATFEPLELPRAPDADAVSFDEGEPDKVL